MSDLIRLEAKVRYGVIKDAEIARAVSVLAPCEGKHSAAWRPDPEGEVMSAPFTRSEDALTYSHVTEVYDFKPEPGFVYGFLVETDGIPAQVDPGNRYAEAITVAIRPNPLLRPEPQSAKRRPDPNLALSAWAAVEEPTTLQIEVGGLLEQESRYVKHVSRWELAEGAADSVNLLLQAFHHEKKSFSIE